MPTKPDAEARGVVRKVSMILISLNLVLTGNCDDAFKEFDYSIEGLTVFYRENETALLHEHQRRRLPGEPWLVKAYRLDARPRPRRRSDESPDDHARASRDRRNRGNARCAVSQDSARGRRGAGRQRDTLATILRLLERGRGARDAADVALLAAIAEAIGDRRFTSSQLLAHALADPALREALTAADITTGQELGLLCFAGVKGSRWRGSGLERSGADRGGVIWCVRVREG